MTSVQKFRRASQKIKIDIGGGAQPRGEDYIIVDKYEVGRLLTKKDDAFWYMPAGKEWKFIKACMKTLPFSDSSVDEIWCAHTLEHLRSDEVNIALKEWLRVLKEEGRAIIQVPNFDYVARYWLTGVDRNWAEQMVYGDQGKPGEEHKTAWSHGILRGDLESAGFEVVRVEVRFNHNQETLQAVAKKPNVTQG